MAQRYASEIGRAFPSTEPDDRHYARRVARYLLGLDSHQPPDPYDEVVVDAVKSMLRQRGYHPAKGGGRPWRSPWD